MYYSHWIIIFKIYLKIPARFNVKINERMKIIIDYFNFRIHIFLIIPKKYNVDNIYSFDCVYRVLKHTLC